MVSVSFKKYFFNTSWSLADQVLRIFTGFFIGFWVARYLGPEQYGALNYSLGFIAILNSLSRLGLDSIVIRELISFPERKKDYLGTSFWIKLISAIFSISILFFWLFINKSQKNEGYLLMILSISYVFQSLEVVDYYFQSQVLSKISSICKISQLLISTLLKVYLLYIKADLIWFGVLISFEAFLLALFYFVAFKMKTDFQFFRSFKLKIAQKLLKDSWPLLLAGISFTIFTNIDVVMIKRILNDFSAGIYSAAYRLTSLWLFIPGLVLQSVMPALVKVKSEINEFSNRLYKITGLLLWFSIFLALATTFFSDEIIFYTFKSDYAESSNILIILIWINVLLFFNSCWNFKLMLINKTKTVFRFHLITACLNIIFNIFFIPIFGVTGAAYAIILSLITSIIIFSFFDREIISLFFKSLSFGIIK